jgi:signal transduction histidine kinase
VSSLTPRVPLGWRPQRALRAAVGLPLPDAVLGVALAVAAVVDTVANGALTHPWTEVLAALTMAPIAWRTRAPLGMALTVAAAFAAYGAMNGTGTPMWSFLGVLVIGFSVGAHLDSRRRALALTALVASTYAVQLMDAARAVGQLTWGEVYFTPPVIILAPAAAGWLLQRARRQTAEVQRLAAELTAERGRHAEAAALAERSRIARELHDIISHSVSVMVVQAGAAENLLPDDHPARVQVRAVRDTGREALAELRRQLGLLRTGGASPVAPMPGLGDLPRLADSMGAMLEAVGDLPGTGSPGLELAAYRVVQEALTNARRHANGGPVQVRLVRRPDVLELIVLDEGGGPADPGARGTGHGLAGLRERVALYGGTVEAGPRRDGPGWQVHARLPLDGAR